MGRLLHFLTHGALLACFASRIENPNWCNVGGNQLTIYRHKQGFVLRITEKHIELAVTLGLEPGTTALLVR